MDAKVIADGLLVWVCMVVIVTFHEFGHAWTASKCGDDTARSQGRVTLNPLAHMDLFGTVLLPLAGVFMGGFFFGWGRPVPVDPANLRRRKLDDILVSMAGPAMNVALAFAVMLIARAGLLFDANQMTDFCVRLAMISMYLCFFNLLPIPPLDGSHVMRHVVGMKEETFLRLAPYGFMILIVLIYAAPSVFVFLGKLTALSMHVMSAVLGMR